MCYPHSQKEVITIEMKERIKKVRTEAGLSQRAFGEKIGVTASSINRLESGENNPSEQTLRLISSNFKINFEWLKYGEGPEMLDMTDDELVDEIMTGSNEYAKSVMKAFAKLGDEEWAMLHRMLEKLKESGL